MKYTEPYLTELFSNMNPRMGIKDNCILFISIDIYALQALPRGQTYQ